MPSGSFLITKSRLHGSREKAEMDKIKVLYITSSLAKMGGAERNLYDIACNIDKERFIPYVLCLKGGELSDELRSKGIYTRVIGLKKILSMDGLKKGVGLFRFIKDEGISVVVTYHHDADIWGGIISRLAGVPVIISSRRDLGYQLERKHIWAYRITNRLYTRVISVCNAVKAEIVKREWLSGDKIITIYNGVHPQNYEIAAKDDVLALKRSLGIGPAESTVGTLGAIRPVKGHIYLVRAAAEVLKKNKKVKFLIVGYKDPEFFEKIRRLVDELGLDKHFIFTGDRRDTARILSILDLFVLPSISEGFSNAVIEAMAAGKPVVATEVGGNPESVVHGKTGMLVRPSDSEAIAEAVLKLLDDVDLQKEMGNEGMLRARSMFTFEKMMTFTEDLYISLLPGNLGKPGRQMMCKKAAN